MVSAAQVANCVYVVPSYRAALLHGGTRTLSVRSEACVGLRPTHSLPPGRRWNIRHGMLRRGRVKWVRRTAKGRRLKREGNTRMPAKIQANHPASQTTKQKSKPPAPRSRKNEYRRQASTPKASQTTPPNYEI